MKRRTKRAEQRRKSRESREASQTRPGGSSPYARKAAYCRKHGVWGWEVLEPKPWK